MAELQRADSRVSHNPYNPFPFHWGASVACGAVAGVVGGYLCGAHLLPFARRAWDLMYMGECSVALCVRGSDWTAGTLAQQASTAVLASYRKGLRRNRAYNSGAALTMHWRHVLTGSPVLSVFDERRMRTIQRDAIDARVMTTRVARYDDPKSFPMVVVGPGPVLGVDTLTDMLRPF